MTVGLLLLLVAGILAIVDIAASRGRAATAWGLLIVCIFLAWFR